MTIIQGLRFRSCKPLRWQFHRRWLACGCETTCITASSANVFVKLFNFKNIAMLCVFLYHEQEISCLLTIQVCKIIHSGIISSARRNYCRGNEKIRRRVVWHVEEKIRHFLLYKCSQLLNYIASVTDTTAPTGEGTEAPAGENTRTRRQKPVQHEMAWDKPRDPFVRGRRFFAWTTQRPCIIHSHVF
jgi:hypothetical protein